MNIFKQVSHKLIGLLLISALLCPVFSLRTYALEPWANNVYVASEGACLMDADTGVVLYGKDEDTAYYPASITKVMTALLTIENCENLSEQVTFSYDAVHIEEENSTIIGASEGDKLSVLDCLYSLLFQSANEVANALAEHVGAKHPELKSEGMSDRDVFILMMNNKAKELGCTGTHFNNPSGLTDSEHYVTAHDMCRILAAAVRNETFLDIESHTYWTHAPIRRYPDANDPWNTVYAKHAMLKRNSSQYYSGAIAGKTGYTMTAGNTLVTAARRDGMTLVTCVLNAHSNHYNDTRRLMDFGFENFKSLKVADYEDANAAIASDFAIGGVNMLNSKTLGVDSDTRVTLPKDGNYAELTKTLELNESSDGSVPATLNYYYGDRQVGSAGLKLIDIGDTRELYLAAKEDSLLANALGIRPKDNSEAATADTGAADLGEGNDAAADEGAVNAVGASNDNTAVNADSVGQDAAAGTTDADNNEAAGRSAAASANAADLGANTADMTGNSSDTAQQGDTAGQSAFTGFISEHKDIIRYIGIGIVAVLILLVLLIVINTSRDKKRAASRARRRASRMSRMNDMSGSDQIRMDLEINRRAKARRRKGH